MAELAGDDGQSVGRDLRQPPCRHRSEDDCDQQPGRASDHIDGGIGDPFAAQVRPDMQERGRKPQRGADWKAYRHPVMADPGSPAGAA